MGTVTLATGSRIYVDANAFIYAAETPTTYPQVVSLFRQLARADHSAVTSILTLAEVLVVPLRVHDAVRVAGYQAQLRSGPVLTVVDVDRPVLVRAAEIRAQTVGVKLPDAIHAATAILSNCDVVLTNDFRLRSVRGLNVVLIADLA